MSEDLIAADQAARRRALDPRRSFIVQAPAGSGKTELLIQRYLVLLAGVAEPEEIAAITFTRKAAAEMKNRVLQALESARMASAEGLAGHHLLTFNLARAALARDAQRGWQLGESASRLRIQTIDALCAALTRQMPVLSALGSQPQSLDNATPLYREAAQATLALLDGEDGAAEDLALLLEHLDNNLASAEDLIATMLARRDHWLRHLSGAADREALEGALQFARRTAFATAAAHLPRALAGELDAMLVYAAGNLGANAKNLALRALAGGEPMPGVDAADEVRWLARTELLLTLKGEWRKPGGLNATLGFPPGGTAAEKKLAKDWKERMAGLLAELDGNEALRHALQALRGLPAVCYREDQWQILGAIVRLMPVAVAQLQLVFAARGQADFVEIAQRARWALGEADAPTDLMLALDYRIHHLLIDEFQDTSVTQFELLEKLTAGWQAGEGGDGRTLFLVGDPMQSIYRFRQAEVGLFLRARLEGLGGVPLEPLALSANFRSQSGIVDWVNARFASIMPQEEDIAAGAVPYAASQAVHKPAPAAVTLHAFFDGDEAGEAAWIATLVTQTQRDEPQGTIAILVRNRNHLRAIVPALKAEGLRFRAIEIEALGHRQCVQDLFSLTRALSHPADRTAWLAVLRAPWCGLTLADLLVLAGARPGESLAEEENIKDLFGETPDSPASPARIDTFSDNRTIWEIILDADCVLRLSADGATRLARLREALEAIVSGKLRAPLRERVESAWLALGGPACVADDTDLDDIDIYLDCLEAHEEAWEIADEAAFAEAVAKLYALPDLHAGEELQILTIHKAKGLEFDTVILPVLAGASGRDERPLLAWMETPLAAGGLLLAPINQTGAKGEPIYEYLRALEGERAAFENTRLLYVAATRARRHLHLSAVVGRDDKGGVRTPAARSLLACLWPVVEGEFAAQALQAPTGGAQRRFQEAELNQDLCRLSTDWRLPAAPPAIAWTLMEPPAAAQAGIEFSWVGETARHVGSVVHRWLQRIAVDALAGWDAKRIEALHGAFREELAALGVGDAELDAATGRVASALSRACDDERGRWLLGPQREARNEYRLTSFDAGELRDWIIDRSFIDADGCRWIVDYKTSSHEGAGLDAFLDRERVRYAAQLENYARLLGGGGRVRLGLYFPLLSAWREWEAVPAKD